MLSQIGAASSVWSTVSSPQLAGATAALARPGTTTAQRGSPFDALTPDPTGGVAPLGSGSSSAPWSPDTMSALIAAQSQQILGQPGSGDSVQTSSKSSSSLISQLDANGDGSISQSDLDPPQKSTQQKGGHRHHHHPVGGGGEAGGAGSAGRAGSGDGAGSGGGIGSGDGGIDALLASDATGATTRSAANADGSTTTTITYADGSKVASTTAPSDGGGSPSSGSGDRNATRFLEHLINIQAQSFSTSAVTPPTA